MASTFTAWCGWWVDSGDPELRDLLKEHDLLINGGLAPRADGEHEPYVDRLGWLLREGATSEAVAGYLTAVQERAGRGGSRGRSEAAAASVVAWYGIGAPR